MHSGGQTGKARTVREERDQTSPPPLTFSLAFPPIIVLNLDLHFSFYTFYTMRAYDLHLIDQCHKFYAFSLSLRLD